MCHESPKVRDFLAKILETDVPEAEYWVSEFRRSLTSTDGFYEGALTSDRAKFVVDDFSTRASQSLSLMARMNYPYYLEMLWRAHMFMDEIRQQAVGLKADVDMAITRIRI